MSLQLTTILNRCYPQPGFVYYDAVLNPFQAKPTIQVNIHARKGARAICSRCNLPAPGYDRQSSERKFQFIPIWGFLVVFLYVMRRVDCKTCGVVVEKVPWASGKHHLTNVYMHFLAHWARKLSWKETAESFQTSWDQVCHAVEYIVGWGLDHRVLGPIRAIMDPRIQTRQ